MSGHHPGLVAAVGLAIAALGSVCVAAAAMNHDWPYARGKWKQTERWFGRTVSRWMLGAIGCTVVLFGILLALRALL